MDPGDRPENDTLIDAAPVVGAAGNPQPRPTHATGSLGTMGGSRPPEDADPRRPRGTPMVEIEVVHEHGPAPSTERPWRTLEVWTRNRVYTTDPYMICIEVKDRVSREVVPDHPFLGMRLVGGQHRRGEQIELSYPYPRPGTEAVFEQPIARRGNFSRTSAVTRVVLRLHVVTVSPNSVVPTWEEITGALKLSLPPPETFG